jgi:hypothetical protein
VVGTSQFNQQQVTKETSMRIDVARNGKCASIFFEAQGMPCY